MFKVQNQLHDCMMIVAELHVDPVILFRFCSNRQIETATMFGCSHGAFITRDSWLDLHQPQRPSWTLLNGRSSVQITDLTSNPVSPSGPTSLNPTIFAPFRACFLALLAVQLPVQLLGAVRADLGAVLLPPRLTLSQMASIIQLFEAIPYQIQPCLVKLMFTNPSACFAIVGQLRRVKPSLGINLHHRCHASRFELC